MFQLLYPSIVVSIVGLILVFVKFALIRNELRRLNSDRFDASDERTSGTSLRNRVFELCITICATFVSFYSAYALQKYKTLVTENNQAAAICFSVQDKVAYFDEFLKNVGIDSSDNFKCMVGIDTSVLRAFVKEFTVGYKPYYAVDRLAQDQIVFYLKPIPYSTLSWLESNEKSALKTTFNEKTVPGYRIRALYAAYQFDSLRLYLFYSEQQYLQVQIVPDSFASRLRAINVANDNLVRMINPAFQSEIPLRFPNY